MNKCEWRKRSRRWKRAAKSCQSDYTTQMYRDNALLAWQRRVRAAAAHYKKAHLPNWCAPLEDLYRAIESETEPKEET